VKIETINDVENVSKPTESGSRGRWKKSARMTAVLVALGLNLFGLLISLIVLGHAMGWLSPARADFPSIIAYGIPFTQFILFAYLLDQSFRFFVQRWAETQALGRPPPRLGLQLGRMVIYFVIVAMSISMVFNRSVTGILAASGVVGLVMGFALRGLVSDLFFGIALHIDRNLSVGDWVDISFRGREISGQIHDIHWRSVVLLDVSDNIVLVPNSEFAGAVVVNRSKPGLATEYSTQISIGTEYECGRVMSVLEMVLLTLVDDHQIQSSPPPFVQIAQIDGGIIKYRMSYCVLPRKRAAADVQSLVLKHAVQYLRAAGCYFYPQLPNYVNPDKPIVDRPYDVAVRQRVIANVPLFRALPPQAIEFLAKESQVEVYPAGATLVTVGEPGDSMWLIAEGAFDIFSDRDGVSTSVATLWPGDWVGEMALLTGEPRGATVRARGSALVYAIRKPLMEQLFANDPDLIKVLAQIAGRRRKSRDDGYASLTQGQDFAKTKTMVARIRAFFGMPASD
jgi:small-conductance mechanosensitive channel/CRP-like cAMP-binding protein